MRRFNQSIGSIREMSCFHSVSVTAVGHLSNCQTRTRRVMQQHSIALITGSGSGIGRGIAKSLFLEMNASVILVGRRRNALEETRDLLISLDSSSSSQVSSSKKRKSSSSNGSKNIYLIEADVSNEEGRTRIVEGLKRDGVDRLDYLIHNAGEVGKLVPLQKLDETAYRQTMATNVEGPIFLTKALMPLLVEGSRRRAQSSSSSSSGDAKATKSRVLHVSSGCAHSPSSSWLSYCVSKAALLMAQKVLASEFQHYGVPILVGTFKPGKLEVASSCSLDDDVLLLLH